MLRSTAAPVLNRIRTTPAIAGNALYVRNAEHFWAFGE